MSTVRTRGTLTAAALALGLTAATLTAVSPPALAEDGDAPIVTDAAPPGTSVTLITGDAVSLITGDDGEPRAVVRPADGRDVSYGQTRDAAGHVSLIPSDARAGLASGRLDPRLFDITGLLAAGYADAHRDDIPVVTERATASAPSLTGAARTAAFPALGMDAATVAKDDAPALWAGLADGGGITTLWLDAPREALLDRSVPQIGADEAHERGLTGTGVTVAVLDSGIDATHPDLAGKIAAAKNFTDSPTDGDKVGHGIHVASTIAGSGAASGGRYAGVAPGATLLNGKVLGDNGKAESWILAGMEWAAVTMCTDVINMSLGGSDTQGIDPLERAVNELSATTGALFVIAAGNDGEAGSRTIGSPGSAEAALTVGAVDHDDRLAPFSSTGPRVGDFGVKPDVTAPGVGIVAARAKGTSIGVPLDANYTALDGTSMATPHVAGAAALLKQRHREWTGPRLKAALIGTAEHIEGYTAFQQGAGRIDAGRATRLGVTAVPGTLNTLLKYGGPDRATTTVTYRNDTDETVRVTLSSGAWTREGEPVRRLIDTDRAVWVPAHGEAAVEVTVGGRRVRDGVYSGLITGTVHAKKGHRYLGEVTTLVGAYVEPEAADVPVTFIRHDGTPQTGLVAQVTDLSTGDHDFLLTGATGTGTLRLAAGKYALVANVIDTVVIDGKTLDAITPVVVPVTVRAGMAPVVIDTRTAASVHGDVDVPGSALLARTTTTVLTGRDGVTAGNSTTFQGQVPMYVMPYTDPDVSYFTHFVFGKAKSNLYGTFSTWRADTVVAREGEVPADAAYHGTTAAMAHVATTVTPQGRPGAMIYSGPLIPGDPVAWAYRSFITTGAVDHWIDYPEGVDEYRYIVQYNSGGDAHVIADVDHSYPVGKRYDETWFAPVLGPAPRPGDAWREGNLLHYEPRNLFTDAVPGHLSEDPGVTGTMTLSQDGTALATSAFTAVSPALEATLPDASGRYTLTVTAQRRRWFHSGAVTASWTFDTARTHGRRNLPLTAFRTTATVGTTTTALVIGADTPMSTATAEVSADGGATWTTVPLTAEGPGWRATVPNPTVTGGIPVFMHLRLSGTDDHGTTVVQTVTGAYLVTA
ncbi:serine protease [Actinorhabdospora filicis]|uniref:Serine protease n=1 Tax=Actinorhabdospora filicis TaxID=1785913 RepID=A0A9W6SF88_9ACTN|nr:S8 family serine peptidase [Actinorhabdospora filicis]GLZ75228.1 serine protease [Actinorhabdospora filicis]